VQTPCLLSSFLSLAAACCILSWLLAMLAIGTKEFFGPECEQPHAHTLGEPLGWAHRYWSCWDMRPNSNSANALMAASNTLVDAANTELRRASPRPASSSSQTCEIVHCRRRSIIPAPHAGSLLDDLHLLQHIAVDHLESSRAHFIRADTNREASRRRGYQPLPPFCKPYQLVDGAWRNNVQTSHECVLLQSARDELPPKVCTKAENAEQAAYQVRSRLLPIDGLPASSPGQGCVVLPSHIQCMTMSHACVIK
jgi:hypothetical protein